MMFRRLSLALGLLMLPLLARGQAEVPAYQTNFPPEEFKARWARVFEQMGPGIAVVQGAASARGFNIPRQTNEFYYLSGIETPHSYIILDGYAKKVIICLPPRNAALEAAEGRVLAAEDTELVKRLTGCDDVWFTRQPGADGRGRGRGRGAATAASAPATATAPASPRISPERVMTPENMARLFKGSPIIYTPQSPAEGAEESRDTLRAANSNITRDPWDARLSREANFVAILQKQFPTADVYDFSPILDNLRSIKSPREVAVIRRASQIAGLAIAEAMRCTRPGVFEYDLDAAGRYVYLINGSKLEGYRSIIAGGTTNINNMHYFRNSAKLQDGDLVLMDYAPDYCYYTSDVTRMWPVNGKFQPWQRELLQFTLEYRNAIMSRIKPGVTPIAIQAEVRQAMEPVFARTKFSKPIYEAGCRALVERGGGVFSHTVGMAVHDAGRYNQREPLKVGMVFSIDPQLRVPAENLYIRYEDVGVVTEAGFENFTDFLASELDEIEKTVGTGGIVQKFPKISEEDVLKMPNGRAPGLWPQVK